MNREIKFRLWSDTNKMMSWGEICAKGFHASMLMSWPNLMQYTGLKDKNGVEIYEGDIVEAIKPEREVDALFDTQTLPEERYELEIRCARDGEWYGHKKDWPNSHFALWEYPELKVIGNIFES